MIPSHLYHYTSFETLKLILQNQTFRFSRLDEMNDPLEGYYDEDSDYRNLVFSSSWTAEHRDELPMWKIYTDLKGVRIKLPIDLFSTTNMEVKKLSDSNFQITSKLKSKYQIELDVNLPYDDDSPMKESYIDTVYGPTKVEYHESFSKLKNGIITIDNKTKNFLNVNLNIIGQRKIDSWSFEKEYRYRLFYSNAIKLIAHKDLIESKAGPKISTRYLDIKFKKESLENIEILFGPKTDKKNMIELTALFKKMGVASFEVTKSKIRIN
nr:DUF2971 domain-containing protein [uncultured Allomuricauda sp.]